jgi:hypothetical protein
MGLSIRGYARHQGVTPAAVRKALKAGRISRGPDGTIEVAAADRAWADRTAFRMPPADASEPRNGGGASPVSAAGAAAPMSDGAAHLDGDAYRRARAAKTAIEAQRAKLELEARKGALISRDRAVTKAFSFARTLRDACLTWPTRIGPQLAAAFDLDAADVTVYLDDQVRQLLTELASERVEF